MPKFLQIKSMFLRSTIMRNPDCSGWGACFLPHQMKNTVQEYGGGGGVWTKEWLGLNGGIT